MVIKKVVLIMNENDDEYYYINGQHYDAMIKSRNLYLSVPFYIKQAKKYGGPILELACGTGRITIPIAKEGIEIVGLDFSLKMLAQARKNSRKHNLEIKWIEADMTNFSLQQKFSLIIMPARAMNWIIENRDIEHCLSCVKNHLRRNGRFIFNVFNPDLEILQRDPSKKYHVFDYPNPDGTGIVEVFQSNTYDKATQINYLNTCHRTKNEEIVKKLKLRMFFPKELDGLLYYNGFILEEKFGTFDEEPFTSESNDQIVICHKN